MKKIILFLTFASLGIVASCSSDDGNSVESPSPTPQSTVTTKINGVQKNFSTIQVVPVVYTDYTDLEVTATLTGSSPATLEMNLEKDSPDSIVYFFQYTENGVFYQPSESFSIIITENANNKLKGSFSGTLIDTGDPMNTIAVTEGTFDIKY